MRTNQKRTVLHATEARFRNGDRIVGANGELNAANKNELIARLAELASLVAQGEVSTAETASVETAAQRRQAFVDAYHSPTSDPAWAELGAAISQELTTRVEREGFMRSILERNEVMQGSVPRIRVRVPNVRAVVSRGPTQIWPQFVRDNYFTTDEFYITANPRVENIEITQGSSDILEDKFFEGLEAILVAEDRVVKGLMDAAQGIYNDPVYYAGDFTPAVLAQVMQLVTRHRLPASTIIFSNDLLTDLLTASAYSTWFDPISKYEIIQTGRVGRLLGLDMITDGYREPSLQVLEPGEFYITTTPNMLGGYTDRGPVESRPQDMFGMHVPARGWAMHEQISILLANARGVAKGKKL